MAFNARRDARQTASASAGGTNQRCRNRHVLDSGLSVGWRSPPDSGQTVINDVERVGQGFRQTVINDVEHVGQDFRQTVINDMERVGQDFRQTVINDVERV